MIFAPLRWLGKNIGTLLLAFALALLVWVSAVINADPNTECTLLIPLNLLGQDENMLLLGTPPDQITVRLKTPQSVCTTLHQENQSLRASIDLSQLGEGQHDIPVEVDIPQRYRPVRLLEVSPAQVTLELEPILSRTLPLFSRITGKPAPGYSAGLAVLSASRVEVSGRKSLVEQVAEARVSLDISNAEEEINRTVPVQLLDANGSTVNGLSLEPSQVTIRQVIERPGTFRDVTVKVVTIGQEAEGYRLTNITVSPQVVTLFSSNPQLLREMPGFVETVAVDLTGATNDIERRVPLVLPSGVSLVGDQSVFVHVGIAAIETSLNLTLNVEVIGLSRGLEAQLSPTTVDVIIFGPLPVLDNLQPQDVRVVADLTGLLPGTYNLEPLVEIAPVGVRTESVLPATLEVTIALPSTPTPLQPPEETATPTVSPTPESQP